MKSSLGLVVALSTLAAPQLVLAESFFVAVDRDGSMHAESPNPPKMTRSVREQLEEAGEPLPEILSIWTTFPMNGNDYGTYFDPKMNDIEGIGLEDFNLPETAANPPLRAALWHNNVLAIDKRADLHNADVEGYLQYLFLLELSHVWGPAIDAPEPAPNSLIGFPFHWSFFLQTKGSPAGGNTWIDNGDGSFTAPPGSPSDVHFSDLDLYLMGLIPPEDVAPFFVIEGAEALESPPDPFWGGAYSAHSFPWFRKDGLSIDVTGTRRDLTIDDVVAANGIRSPESGVKTSYSLGIVLVVDDSQSAEEVAALKEAFEPVALSLPVAFEQATDGRGQLDLILGTAGGGSEGGGTPEGGQNAGGQGWGGSIQGGAGGSGTAPAEAEVSGGCATTGDPSGPSFGWGVTLSLLALLTRRR